MVNVSTVIPVYLGSGLPIVYLEQAVRSVLNQTHVPIEIILTDDSTGNEVANWLDGFEGNGVTSILYVRNTGPRGVSSNSNFGAVQTTGEFIHFLHADDCVINPHAYSKALFELRDKSKNWLLFSGQTGESVTIPNVNDLNLFGVNSVGGPSSIFIRRQSFFGFDESLSMLMDIDFLLRTLSTSDFPIISSDVSIRYGSGSWQIQQNTSQSKLHSEFEYLWQMRKIDISTFHQLLAIDGAWDLKRDAIIFLRKTSRINALEYIQYRIGLELIVFLRKFINRYNKNLRLRDARRVL